MTLTLHNIELRKDKRRTDPVRGGGESYPLNRGGFDILVDGKLWGRTQQQTHGCHGSTYELLQIGADGVARNAYEVTKRGLGGQGERLGDHRSKIFIWSDKHYLRAEFLAEYKKNPDAEARPLEDRIRFMAAKAIKDGWLRDPAALKAEALKAAEEYRAKEARERQHKEDVWLKKAAEVIGPANHALSVSAAADLRARIVAAMKWAQTQ